MVTIESVCVALSCKKYEWCFYKFNYFDEFPHVNAWILYGDSTYNNRVLLRNKPMMIFERLWCGFVSEIHTLTYTHVVIMRSMNAKSIQFVQRHGTFFKESSALWRTWSVVLSSYICINDMILNTIFLTFVNVLVRSKWAKVVQNEMCLQRSLGPT